MVFNWLMFYTLYNVHTMFDTYLTSSVYKQIINVGAYNVVCVLHMLYLYFAIVPCAAIDCGLNWIIIFRSIERWAYAKVSSAAWICIGPKKLPLMLLSLLLLYCKCKYTTITLAAKQNLSESNCWIMGYFQLVFNRLLFPSYGALASQRANLTRS